jgi:hypothetical protein
MVIAHFRTWRKTMAWATAESDEEDLVELPARTVRDVSEIESLEGELKPLILDMQVASAGLACFRDSQPHSMTSCASVHFCSTGALSRHPDWLV